MNVLKTTILFLLFNTTIVKAQSINIYPINGAIGFKFLHEKRISLEPRIDAQFDLMNGESNLFVATELFTTVNFMRENQFNFYSGLGLGANIYNQASTNFNVTLPFGATYYFNEKKRIAIIGECGIRTTFLDFVKVKSYALVGLQISLKRNMIK